MSVRPVPDSARVLYLSSFDRIPPHKKYIQFTETSKTQIAAFMNVYALEAREKLGFRVEK